MPKSKDDIIEELREELAISREDFRRIRSILKDDNYEMEQILGYALGYPPFPIFNGMDYSKSPAEPTDEPDSKFICVGDNVMQTLALEAAEGLRMLRTECPVTWIKFMRKITRRGL